jgi:hypothetical protein
MDSLNVSLNVSNNFFIKQSLQISMFKFFKTANERPFLSDIFTIVGGKSEIFSYPNIHSDYLHSTLFSPTKKTLPDLI